MSVPTWRVLVGDVREQLRTLQGQSVQTCVTSPPYWGLRDYGVDGQIGLESTPDAYVQSLIGVFREVRRVLKDDGTLWLNLGDSYAGSGRGGNPDAGTKQGTNKGSQTIGVLYGREHEDAEVERARILEQKRSLQTQGIKPKDLVGIPWMVAFALRADGWYLRSDIIWAKPNPMPESVTDRPTKAHEYIFLLSKSERYYFDQDAVREPLSDLTLERWNGVPTRTGPNGADTIERSLPTGYAQSCGANENGRNCRSVWTITTQPYPEAHFATFPEAIPERCIKAGSKLGDTVLDPFCGSGTTGQVAVQSGRSFLGVELNSQYAKLARTRIGGAAPLFALETA